jgi:hypothetical protein
LDLATIAALALSAALVLAPNRKEPLIFNANQYALELREKAHARPCFVESPGCSNNPLPSFCLASLGRCPDEAVAEPIDLVVQ